MPQIDVVSHTQGKQCTACHNPHSPLFSPAGAPVALASSSGGTGDAAAGKTKSALCAACHGPAGVSAVADFPNLACQKEPYLTGALTAYQSGTRGNAMMGAIAKSLSKADIRNLAAYFAGLSCAR
ncbi:MAG: cytochrome c [Alphaproteobacteria bacterium]|nr:cytochrome c [Alphaproteobacteria bacterium]MDE2630749.1 cytochrome c [Alphaproteobacteria bacterium]